MGISTISKLYMKYRIKNELPVSIPNGDKHDFKTFHKNHSSQILYVSIPNGDKHDFKTAAILSYSARGCVSIPNGDKHDFKTKNELPELLFRQKFQSPMGISTISKPTLKGFGRQYAYGFNPQWG